MENKVLENALRRLLVNYTSELAQYRFHVDEMGEIVDYNARMKLVHKQLADEYRGDFEHLEFDVSINSLLDVITFRTYLSTMNKLDGLIAQLAKIEERVLLRAKSKSFRLEHVLPRFIELLKAFDSANKRWRWAYSKSKTIPITLRSVSSGILKTIELSSVDELDDRALVMIADLFEKITSLLLNIDYLPMYDSSGTEIAKIDLEWYLSTHREAKHTSFVIVDFSVGILVELMSKGKENRDIEMAIQFFDILNELVKKFDQQKNFLDPNKFIQDMLRVFEHCRTLETVELVLDHLAVAKTMLHIKSNMIEMSRTEAIKLFAHMNPSSDTVVLEKLFAQYTKWFEATKAEFVSGSMGLREMADRLRVMRLEKTNDIRQTLVKTLATLAWALTARVSRMADQTGHWRREWTTSDKRVEFTPHVVQILGAMRMLALDRGDDELKNAKTVSEWLARVPRQLGEVLTGQGKSWQLALISMVYAINDYDVTVACYSEYLSRRDEQEINRLFVDFDVELKRVHYRTLKQLAADRIEGAHLAKCKYIVINISLFWTTSLK